MWVTHNPNRLYIALFSWLESYEGGGESLIRTRTLKGCGVIVKFSLGTREGGGWPGTFSKLNSWRRLTRKRVTVVLARPSPMQFLFPKERDKWWVGIIDVSSTPNYPHAHLPNPKMATRLSSFLNFFSSGLRNLSGRKTFGSPQYSSSMLTQYKLNITADP